MPLFYSLWVEMLKNGPFQNLTQVVASILVTSVMPPTPPPFNFAEFGALALNKVIYAPHDHNTGRVY